MGFLRHFALLTLIVFGGPSHAAKVVRLYNAWPDQSYPFQILGWWNGQAWNGPGTTGNVLRDDGTWYGFELPATYDPTAPLNGSGVFFGLQDWSVTFDAAGLGRGQVLIDIGSVLKTSDTVWIFPAPLPDAPPLLAGTRPRQTRVMFASPWDTSTPGMEYESHPWRPMAPSGLPQWHTAFALGFQNLWVRFRNSDSTSQFGALGALPQSPAFLVPDSLASRDTVWILPDASGRPTFQATRPVSKVLMVLNPWGATVPMHHPRLTIGGAGPYTMIGSETSCGWYEYSYFHRPRNALFTEDPGTGRAGADGIGGATPIDLSTVFSTSDTAWISYDSATGAMDLRAGWNGRLGLCEVVKLAATLRDFATGAFEFGYGSGCAQGGFDRVRGMVESELGTDRKPVRSAREAGARVGGQWAYRCTYSNQAGARAVIGDTGIATTWFRDVPGKVGVEYGKTCRDIPLSLDATGNYTHNSPYFFPVDDFSRQDDGTANPGFDLTATGGDGKRHNYGFCLESHGTFDYKKGQVFNFTGDDDVWFFVNNRLVVDIGGIHAPVSESVQLDTIGVDPVTAERAPYALVPGNTYTWDFFFCERNPSGSSMRISTSMNLRTQSGFEVRDTAEGPGVAHYTTYVSRTNGQGCRATTQVTRSASRYALRGAKLPASVPLTSGTWYGGITIDTVNGRARIDSVRMQGLVPGLYHLRIFSAIDSLAYEDVPFVVPLIPLPLFVGKSAYTGIVGSSFPVSVGAFNQTGVDSSALPFVLRPVPGLVFYKDSLLTIPVGSGDTLRTGMDGIHRRIWVKGVAAGSYSLVVGKTSADSTDSYTSIVFQGTGLRFVDASGNAVTLREPIVANLSDTLVFRVEAHAAGVRCASCLDSVGWGSSTPGLRFLDAAGRAIDGIRLVDGYAMVRVVATAPLRSGALTGIGTKGDTLDWRPISFVAPRLAFVDDQGREISRWEIDTLADAVVGPIEVRAKNLQGDCADCTGPVAFASDVRGMRWVDSSGREVANPVLGNGRIRLWLELDREALFVRLVASHAVYDPDTLDGLSFRVDGPARAALFDADGDGRPDSLSLQLRSALRAGDTLVVRWPDPSGEERRLAIASDRLSNSVLGFAFAPFGVQTRRLSGPEDPLGTWITLDARGRTVLKRFSIDDSIAPVATEAMLRFSSDPLIPDTLIVKASEPLRSSGGFDWIAWGRPSRSPSGALVPAISGWLSDDTTTATLLVHAGTAFPIRVGDSVRIAGGAGISDLLGNRPGTKTVWIPVAFGPHPPNLQVDVVKPVRATIDETWRIPPGEAPLDILTRDPNTGEWFRLGGGPVPDTSRLSGIWVQTNGPWNGRVIVYDNLGNHVADQDLSALADAYNSGALLDAGRLDSRGGIRFWLSWNGTSTDGKKVAGGIYPIRLLLSRSEPGAPPVIFNKIFRVGWKRNVPVPPKF